MTYNISTLRNQKERRLDALARLLEGKDICAAVCVKGDRILITTNAIHDGSRQKTIDRLTSTVELAKKQSLTQKDKDFFADLVLNNFKSNIQQGANLLEDERVKEIAKSFLEKDAIENWHQKTIQQLNEECRTPTELSNFVLASSITERMATDLLKTRKEFLDEGLDLFRPDMEIEVIRGNKETHAEMKILDKIFKDLQKKNSPLYIGISKKCCKKCTQVIKAVNQTIESDEVDSLNSTTDQDISELSESRPVTEEELSSMLEKTDLPIFIEDDSGDEKEISIIEAETDDELELAADAEDPLTESGLPETDESLFSEQKSSLEHSSFIRTSGSHSYDPQEKKWKMPEFLKQDGKIFQEIRKNYNQICEEDKQQESEPSTKFSMMRSRSTSPAPSLSEDDDIHDLTQQQDTPPASTTAVKASAAAEDKTFNRGTAI